MIALSLIGSKKKKKHRKKSFNSFCLSLPPHLQVFCEVEIGNAPLQMPIPNRIEVPLPRRVKSSTVGLRNLRLALSRSMIVSSAGVIWVSGYRVISDADEGEKRAEA